MTIPCSLTIHRISVAALLLSLQAAPAAVTQEVLVSPDDTIRSLLIEKLSNAAPDFEAMARRLPTVRSADEFDRPDVLRREVDRLQAVWDGLDDTRAIRLRMGASLGEYDAGADGFPLDLFAPGVSVGGRVPIVFANSSEARIFPVSKDRGREVVANLGISRGVTVDLTLDDLRASPLRAGTIEGRVAEVVVTGRDQVELGRYELERSEPSGGGDGLGPQAVAERIAETLDIPVAGMTWDEIDTFLKAQPLAKGYTRYGPVTMTYEDGNYDIVDKNFTPGTFEETMIFYGATEDTIGRGVREMGKPGSLAFGKLDCLTPDVADACGMVRLQRTDGDLFVTEVMTVSELPGVPYGPEVASETFGEEVVAGLDRVETQVRYTSSDLGGSEGRRPAAAMLYWAGSFERDYVRMHDLRAGFRESYRAPTMLWLVDGQDDRTIVVTRSVTE